MNTCQECGGTQLQPERYMGDPQGGLPCTTCAGGYPIDPQCERNGHVKFRDRRTGEESCTVCKNNLNFNPSSGDAIVGTAVKKKPSELQSPYQPGVAVILREEVDDDMLRDYRSMGLVFGEGTLIGPSKYGGDYYLCEFTDQNGKSLVLSLSPNMFMVVDNEKSKSILVDAMLRQ